MESGINVLEKLKLGRYPILRAYIGPIAFASSVANLAEKYTNNTATSEDYLAVASDIAWFFAFYAPHPYLRAAG